MVRDLAHRSLIQPGINVSAEVFRVGRVKLRLIEYDYRILRKFEGRGLCG